MQWQNIANVVDVLKREILFLMLKTANVHHLKTIEN